MRTLTGVAAAVATGVFTAASMAQSVPAAKPLWPGGAPLAQGTADADVPTLTAFLPAQNPTKTAVIIAPGGGYQHLATEKEGNDIARWMNAHGVAAYVLKYRLGPKYHHPAELDDMQRAIRSVRAGAGESGIAKDHIGVVGFSAGGHLAATAETLYDDGLKSGDAIDRVSSKPDFAVLCYPVITMVEPTMHKGSHDALLGDASRAVAESVSPELHVTKDTPPTFLYSTSNDAVVPIANSILMYQALIAARVPVEMHLFEKGAHGSGLAQSNPALKEWPDLLATWMRAHGWME